MGDRLAFNNGIVFLSIVAALVFIAFSGNTSSLIPLYAVGVFLAFTLSQAGMVVHWWRQRGARWRTSIAINAMGCAMSAIVFLIAAVTKFTAGAWVSLLIVITFTGVALLTRRHFDRVAGAIALSVSGPRDRRERGDAHRDLQPHHRSDGASGPGERARPRLRSLAGSARDRAARQPHRPRSRSASASTGPTWGNHVPLELIQSPYRTVIPPTVAYIESLHAQRPDLTLTVVVPDLALHHCWQRLLHEDTAVRLRHALAPLSKVVVTSVPFHV